MGIMDKKPTVSIIVPVAGEKDLIAGTLSHLLALDAYEVIVVDAGSKDGTPEIVKAEFPSVRYFETKFR